MKEYTVSTISEYLAIIEKNDISNYIYRGQNEPYFFVEASGFRPYKGGWSSDTIYDMPYIHSAFYDRIIGQLSEDEKLFFLAFCQHHGIPTNLVDVTYSPLVALFFACDGKSEKQFALSEFIGDKSLDAFEQDTSSQHMFIDNLINQARKPFHSPFAQIYMIDKIRLINITDIIVELNDKNLFEEMLCDKKLLFKFSELIKTHFKNIDSSTLNSWLGNLLTTYVDIFKVDEFSELFNELGLAISSTLSESTETNSISYTNIIQILKEYHLETEWLQTLFNHKQLTTKSLDHITASQLYTILLFEILSTLKNAPQKVNIDLDIYFVYKPPQLFKRISSQQSFFIYQPYLYTNDGVYDYCELNIQTITPDILIQIDNYANILKELNILGIDNGTIYGDIDSIAKSVLNSSGRLLKV